MPINYSDILSTYFGNFLIHIEETIQKLGYNQNQYERLNGIDGFKINQDESFATWVMWDKSTERLTIIGKILHKLPAELLNSMLYNINDINAKTTEGRFVIIHNHLAFIIIIDISNIVISYTSLINWINLPFKSFNLYADHLNERVV